MQVQLTAVPYDSGRRGERMGAGPMRLIEAGNDRRLVAAGHQLHVQTIEAPDRAWLAEIRTTFDLVGVVSRAVTAAVGDLAPAPCGSRILSTASVNAGRSAAVKYPHH